MIFLTLTRCPECKRRLLVELRKFWRYECQCGFNLAVPFATTMRRKGSYVN